MDFPAVKTTQLTGLNHKTIDDWYNYIRNIIYLECEKEKQDKLWWWVYELDESYFWPKRIRWKRWRWAWWKTIVFWLLKRWWTDWWRAYHGLVEMWYEKHYRVHHGKNEFARWKKHINWIESFWSFTKRRFIKFNGIKKEFFLLYLKESEFRYNVRIEKWNLYKILLKKLRNFNP